MRSWGVYSFMTYEDSQGTGQGSRVGCILLKHVLSSFSLCMGNYK